MKLQSTCEYKEGLDDEKYNAIFTLDKPILFGFHGYISVIQALTCHRTNRNLRICGYQEEGTITTPFDMRVQNKLDRFHLVIDALNLLPEWRSKENGLSHLMQSKLQIHHDYIRQTGRDMPEITNWHW